MIIGNGDFLRSRGFFRGSGKEDGGKNKTENDHQDRSKTDNHNYFLIIIGTVFLFF